jgi:ring-1,2-phenylacetyl-CoA epoxidase subunit PaaD
MSSVTALAEKPQHVSPGLDPAALIAKTWQVLEAIPDPEIPVVSIRELGILRDVQVNESGQVVVVITPTYSGCPAIGQIEDDVRSALAQAQIDALVTTRLFPAWTTDWLTPSAHTKLRQFGIAPPNHRVETEYKTINFAIKNISNSPTNTSTKGVFNSIKISCPLCGSPNTTETSHFASTACKALYKCLNCQEPFDYFKPF